MVSPRMKPEELLDKVQDRRSFIDFVEALAAEREEAQAIESENPEMYFDGALNWKNAQIGAYLYACLDYFEDKPYHKPEKDPSWKMFAEFLYFGKIIE